MFRFVVKYLGFVKHVPFFATVFDSMIMLWNNAFNPHVIKAIECIESELATWEGIERLPHKFGGIQFNREGKEIGHIHSNGILDILFTRKIKNELLRTGSATDHHVFSNSGWITFYIRSSEDIQNAISLLARSYNLKFSDHRNENPR